MGKTKGKTKSFRSVPLEQQLLADNSVKPITRQKKRKRDEADDIFIDERTAKKILRQIDRQREEQPDTATPLHSLRNQKAASDSESEEDVQQMSDAEESDNEVDQAAVEEFAKFANVGDDSLVKTVQEKCTEIMTQCSDATGIRSAAVIEPQLKGIFGDVGKFLSQYRSGKLPKPFRSIPKIRNWEDFLELTKPENWTAAAMREATRMFISNFKKGQAEKFLKMYLLPRVRDDLATFKRLNPHLFQAIERALFKAEPFMTGFLLPLCESGTCTLQEATIIGGILKKVSIPVTYTASALVELAKLPYSGATMLIIQSLLDKKYSLPLVAINILADYFLSFIHSDEPGTVIWHQGLLTFVQLCKNDIDEERKESLLELVKVRQHHEITNEIRRELSGKN